MRRLTKEEWLSRAMQVRDLGAGRLVFLLMAMSEGVDRDAQQLGLSLALNLSPAELARANEELLRVGLAEYVPRWLS